MRVRVPAVAIAALAALLCSPAVTAQLGVSQDGFSVSGILVLPDGKPASGRLLEIVPTTNLCPDTCSCGTGRCEGKGPECKDKFCVYNLGVRSRRNGEFAIVLPSARYDLYADRIAPERKLPEPLIVNKEPIKALRYEVPFSPLVAQ